MASNIQTKVLRRQQSTDEYRVYMSALEWDLTDPIVIEKREDFKSEYRWRNRLSPYHHQVTNLITFCRRLPVTLLADDVGLGKTISAGLVMSELMSRSRIRKVLVVCPKLLGPQWKEELETKFDIPTEIAVGKKVVDAEPEDVGAIVTTYTSARLYLDAIPENRFQMLILDEAHKLRNLYGVDTPPQVATRFRKVLQERRFPFVLMLTATPIHNRLWDLYSLVDLLTVARGHQNPFGGEGMFARRFIADSREQARRLKSEARDEFRSIVYGYMSRVRRGDARLYFPDREIQMHRVEPTQGELDLIRAIAKPIQKLNRLAQISILQALVSSPDALMSQLVNMSRRGTVPMELASIVKTIVQSMPLSAKLRGLQVLIEQLKKKNPDRWRLVVFTTRIETQTTIQNFLETNALTVGIINGNSSSRNQDTLKRFRNDPPDCHVIVSTEAGAEGVNLQVANVLVNYDLPWNPMIVEQRIGRVQRLASQHAKVGIFNIILRGTFEEYIVGRLMEKLQMASSAIGDMEALLEASGIDDDEENGVPSFDEKVRQLVVASLAGKDVELEMQQAEKSIADAKAELEMEEATINELLGEAEGKEYVGPRAPKLPAVVRSMTPREFTIKALTTLGANVSESAGQVYVEEDGMKEAIRFEEDTVLDRSTLYAPGTPAFSRLVNRIVSTGVHNVRDLDVDPVATTKKLAGDWVKRFGAVAMDSQIHDVRRNFRGTALLRVRATVAHDSYERLVEIRCSDEHASDEASRSFIAPLGNLIDDPRAVGIALQPLVDGASLDEPVSEFSRFYLERRNLEIKAAGDDERKRRKLEDEFTPRLEVSLVGLDGELHRNVTVDVKYKVDDVEYSSRFIAKPYMQELIERPLLGKCGKTGRQVPIGCLQECQISGARVLRHLLVQSEKSQRRALPEFTVVCALSGKRLLRDEVEQSEVTNRSIDESLLKISALSGRKAEPEHFGECEFTGGEVLRTELAKSEISGRLYREDQRGRSVVSGKSGHTQEFIVCSQTGQSLTVSEAEQCQVTGSYVKPGILEQCAITSKRVLPQQLGHCEVTGKRVLASELEKCEISGKAVLRSELARCEVTGKHVLSTLLESCAVSGKHVLPSELERCPVSGKSAVSSLFVTSSISQVRLLERVAIRSAIGLFCAPFETQQCVWSGRTCHPADLRTCELTGLPILFQFAGSATNGHALQPLRELLEGLRRNADKQELWPTVANNTREILGRGRCRVEAAILSPGGLHLAACLEVRTMLGLKVQQAGLVYSINEGSIVGRMIQGQRKPNGWIKEHV